MECVLVVYIQRINKLCDYLNCIYEGMGSFLHQRFVVSISVNLIEKSYLIGITPTSLREFLGNSSIYF